MALGVVAALAVLAGRAHLSAGAVLAVSLAASAAGAAGARIWYVALNRGKAQGIPTQGLCIQGFILGAVVILIPGVALAQNGHWEMSRQGRATWVTASSSWP